MRGRSILMSAAAAALGLSLTFATPADVRAQSTPPVTGGLVYHLDASDLDGDNVAEGLGENGLGAGNRVATWVDKGAGDGDQTAVQATAGSQPLFVPTGPTPSARPVVRFDGLDDFMTSPAFSSVIPNAQVFLVWKADSTGPVASVAFDGLDGSDRNAVVYEQTGGTRIGTYAGGTGQIQNYTDPTTFPEPVVMTATFNANGPGLHNIRLNGVEVINNTTAADGGQGLDGVTVGARFGECCGDGNLSLDGYIAEILIYNGALTGPQRNSVEAYLNDKWLEVPEPAGLSLLALGGVALLGRRRIRRTV